MESFSWDSQLLRSENHDEKMQQHSLQEKDIATGMNAISVKWIPIADLIYIGWDILNSYFDVLIKHTAVNDENSPAIWAAIYMRVALDSVAISKF